MCEPVSETSRSVGTVSPAGASNLALRSAEVDPRVDRDADRVAGVVDPGQDLVRVGRELLEAGPRVEFGCAAHHAASDPTLVTLGAADVSPPDQYRTRRGVISMSARSKKSGSATRALRK